MKFPRLQMLFTILSIPCLLLGHPLEIEKSAFPSDRILNISEDFLPKGKNNVVLHTKQIRIDGFPNAFNPSLIKTEKGTLLFFRNQPYFETLPFISETGYVRLNEALDPISAPQLISTRNPGDPTPQQSEDCRVFSLGNELYLIYNDNLAVTSPSDKERRDIFVAKLIDSNGRFVIDTPKKLTHSEKYKTVLWQKNWQPFDWEGTLMMGYTINPMKFYFPIWKQVSALRFSEPKETLAGTGKTAWRSSCTAVRRSLSFFFSFTYSDRI